MDSDSVSGKSHGFVTLRSSPSKSATFRVATHRSCALAVPAMSASPKSRCRPRRRASARRRAAWSAALRPTGRTRSSYRRTNSDSTLRSATRRLPEGRRSRPNSSSCSTRADSQRSSRSARKATTGGAGVGLVSSEITLVSSRTPLTRGHPRRRGSRAGIPAPGESRGPVREGRFRSATGRAARGPSFSRATAARKRRRRIFVRRSVVDLVRWRGAGSRIAAPSPRRPSMCG